MTKTADPLNRFFESTLVKNLGTKWSATFLALLWAQGAPLGYSIHQYMFHSPSNETFIGHTSKLMETNASTLLYIWIGTSVFFSIFGYMIGSFLCILKRQNERLKELDKMKDEYVAVCSHDLRSPLNGVIGYSQLLLMENKLDEFTRESVQYIESCGLHLLKIIEEILDLNRMHSGNSEIKLERTDLSSVLSEVFKFHENMASKKGIELKLQTQNINNAWIDGNELHLIRAIGNLVSNAIKFTPKGGVIDLSLKAVGTGFFEIAVKDSGIGIPQDKVSTILTNTKGIRRAGTEGEKSTGLGLEIVKDVVQQHFGSLSVESEKDKGATFCIKIPTVEVSVAV